MSRPGTGSLLPLLPGTSSGSLHSASSPTLHCALVYFQSQACSKQGFPKLFLALDSPLCLLHAHSPQHLGGCPHITLLMTRLSEGGG